MNSARENNSTLNLASWGGRANGQSVHNDPGKPEKQNISKIKDEPRMLLKAKYLISDKMPYASTLLKLKELTF